MKRAAFNQANEIAAAAAAHAVTASDIFPLEF
jgi:hypothetical protein